MAKNRIGSNPLDSLIPDPQSGKGARQQDSEPESRNDVETERQNTSKTVSQPGGKMGASSEADKVKATFYLPSDVEADLERAWLQLRRLTGRKVSKSDLVAAALRALVEDVEAKGERSGFAKRLR